MSLDYTHIRDQLQRIIHDYKAAEGYERGQSQNFWTQVFNAYGVSGQRQTKAFEHRLKDDKNQKYVDAFIPSLVMIEQKSRGVDLNKAYIQVSEYYDRINAKEKIAKVAQGVLDASKHYQDGSEDAPTLAQLYNTYLIDPYPRLTKAHQTLDKAVDSAYGYKGKGDDASRVEFLIERLA